MKKQTQLLSALALSVGLTLSAPFPAAASIPGQVPGISVKCRVNSLGAIPGRSVYPRPGSRSGCASQPRSDAGESVTCRGERKG